MNPIAFLATIVGKRAAAPVFYACLAFLALAIFGVVKCSADRDEVEQARQTGRSSEAMADAAQNAVAEIVSQSSRDRTVDEVVTQAAREIDGAKASQDARRAALNAVCSLPEYQGDPQCE